MFSSSSSSDSSDSSAETSSGTQHNKKLHAVKHTRLLAHSYTFFEICLCQQTMPTTILLLLYYFLFHSSKIEAQLMLPQTALFTPLHSILSRPLAVSPLAMCLTVPYRASALSEGQHAEAAHHDARDGPLLHGAVAFMSASGTSQVKGHDRKRAAAAQQSHTLMPWHHGCSDASSSKRGDSLNASCGGGCK